MEAKVSRTSERKEKSASIDFDDQLKNVETGKRSNENEGWFANQR